MCNNIFIANSILQLYEASDSQMSLPLAATFENPPQLFDNLNFP